MAQITDQDLAFLNENFKRLCAQTGEISDIAAGHSDPEDNPFNDLQ